MIKTLKRKFILLAMVSLTVLLAFIVSGMNIINYNKVVSDADARLDVLEENSERILSFHNDENASASGFPGLPGTTDTSNGPADGNGSDLGKGGKNDGSDFYFGRGGPGGPSMSRDEAEESRFFMVILDSDGSVKQTNIDRIFSVDKSEAADYAAEAAASGDDKGFIDELRYSVTESGETTRVTFLDCGRVLESYRDFLRASIIMSLAGLLIVFAAIVYFSGRIVRPVAESYEKQKRFITDAGHEIKTPLAIIKANLDVIELDPDSSEECLEEIGNQTDRLAELTNDLVYLSRMEEAGGNLVMTDVPLSEIVTESAVSFAGLAKDRGKTIEADVEPMLSVQGSTKELEKLISILLENAVKYSSDREAIKLSLRKDGRSAVLEVGNRTDTPVDRDSLPHVFERFYRTDSSRNSATGGHGIGLSMASAIVSAHKGKIAAHTTDGSDFTVTVTLPA